MLENLRVRGRVLREEGEFIVIFFFNLRFFIGNAEENVDGGLPPHVLK